MNLLKCPQGKNANNMAQAINPDDAQHMGRNT